MAGKADEILTLLFGGFALGFWLIAMTTHGWLIISKYTPPLGKTVELKLGVFYAKKCEEYFCNHGSLLSNNEIERFELPTHIEMQIESVIAALLCAVCCFLLLTSFQSTSKRFLHVAIILLCAVLFESVLIGRTSKANANLAAQISEEINRRLKFPYPILLAGVGMLFAIVAWVLSIAIYCKLRKLGSQSTQDLELTEAAMVSQDHYSCIMEAANIPYSGPQVPDMEEAAYSTLKSSGYH